MFEKDINIVNQILSLLRQNHLPDPNIIFDRRDTVLYIQQLVDRVRELELYVEDAHEELGIAEEVREYLEKAMEAAKETHILQLGRVKHSNIPGRKKRW